MIEKLEVLKKRFVELTELLADSSSIGTESWKENAKEHSKLAPIIEAYDRYLKVGEDMAECEEMMATLDKEMADLASIEFYELKDKQEEILQELKIMLIPKDPMDEKNVIIEIRSGAGGEEASLFGYELMRMYYRFAERLRWSIEELNSNMTELGGVKEVTFMIKGKGAYSKIKYESGVHRVQRVPATESQGRVHTSTVTVAVLPEAEEVDVEINDKDIKIDTYRSGGAGGQHVNKTESAVRITHLPTGIVAECQDERSQIKNRDKAWKVLIARLYEHYQSLKDKEYASERRMQVGTGDRSERIRTYNYPQGRVTDHRISMTMYSLPDFLDGNIFDMVEALAIADQTAKLSHIDGI